VSAGFIGIHQYQPAGETWKRTTIASGDPTLAADLNGDGRVDIACIGTATANLKWYENIGR
jgi:hypothetical protein